MTDTDWSWPHCIDLTIARYGISFRNCSFISSSFKDDLESELVESPEREPVSHSINGKSRRNFGTCQIEQTTRNKPELNLMEWGFETTFINYVVNPFASFIQVILNVKWFIKNLLISYHFCKLFTPGRNKHTVWEFLVSQRLRGKSRVYL